MTAKKKIWDCKIGEVDRDKLPPGSDLPMRNAIRRAYIEITGIAPNFIFSGWGAELDEGERAVVEDRRPDPEWEKEKYAERRAPDLVHHLKLLLECMDRANKGAFANGVTSDSGMIDEGEVLTHGVMESARKLIKEIES